MTKVKVNSLECSSKGDKRYSAFYAKVSVFGETKSIEDHYQLSKLFQDSKGNITKANSVIEAKCMQKQSTYKLIGFNVGGCNYGLKHLTAWYKLLWVKYLNHNPQLVDYAKQFDYFTDMFKGKNTLNCQADVIAQYVRQGRNSIMLECNEFIGLITEQTKSVSNASA